MRSKDVFLRILHDKLQKIGFREIGPSPIKGMGESIYNRGNENCSNFFVFAKRGFLSASVLVHDPTKVEKEERVKRIRYWGGDAVIEAQKAVDAIMDASLNKPENRWYTYLHGHVRIPGDDGSVKKERKIRDMLIHHIDIDASGCHNNIPEDHITKMRELLAPFSILKQRSLELTLPLKPLRSNGPHWMLYFADKETTDEFVGKFPILSIVQGFPSFIHPIPKGIEFYLDKFLDWVKRKREENRLAVMVAHPFLIQEVPVFNRAVSISLMGSVGKRVVSDKLREYLEERGINEAETRLGPREALWIIKEFADGIEGYNPTMTRKIEESPNKYVALLMRWMKRFVLFRNMFNGIDENAYSLSLAYHLKRKMGKWIGFGPDDHATPPRGFFWLGLPSLLSFGRTEIVFDHRPDETEVTRIMRNKEGSIHTSLNIEVKDGSIVPSPELVGERRMDITKPFREAKKFALHIVRYIEYALKLMRKEKKDLSWVIDTTMDS